MVFVRKRSGRPKSVFTCRVCSKNLLNESDIDRGALIIQTTKKENEDDSNYVYDIFSCCKGKCLQKLEKEMSGNDLEIGGSESISDLINPGYFLSWIKEKMQRMYNSVDSYSVDAFKHLMEVIDKASPFTFRAQTKRQKERMEIIELFK